ncbi:MAG TPA: GGDEF domain-containing protein, partial [Thermoanaerobaculia bacterium]
DEVLKAVSKLFQESIRSTDLAARYGGEEFAVMMPETDVHDAMAFAEKIRKLIEATPLQTQAGQVPVTVSIGVAAVPHPKIHAAKELIVAADNALYRAKNGGRNQVQAEERQVEARARAR